MHDRDGHEVIQRTPISFPDAYQVIVRSVAVRPDGTLLVSAEVWDSKATAAVVLCKVVAPGKIVEIVRTGDFVPDSTAIAANGDLWAFGSPIIEKNEPNVNHPSIARFDSQGLLKSRDNPRSDFGTVYRPSLHAQYGRSLAMTSSNRVAFYSSGASLLLELDSSGVLIGRTEIARLSNPSGKRPFSLVHMVMTDSGRIYAFFFSEKRVGEYGLFQLDREKKRWVSVPMGLLPDGYSGLYGVDGEELILRSGPDRYGWFAPPDVVGDRS